MAVRFIHTADWQIGKPFTQFPKDWQVRLTDARLDAIDRMAQLARDNRAAFVLVAGDLFDSDGLGGVTLQAPFARMAEAAPVHWHVLPGNHDPARPGGIWDRAARAGLPGNVTVHTTPVPVEIGHDVTLLPAPLIARRVANDPTVWMDDATSTPGNIRLGLAHGAIGRYGSDDHASVPLDPARAEKASLDYLALGDDHGLKEINARTWYSGTPEPDGFRDNAPGHALLVDIPSRGAPVGVTAHRVARFAWAELEAGVDATGEIVGLETALDGLPATRRNCVVRLALKGAVALDAAANVGRALDRLAAQGSFVDADRSGLRRTPSLDDLSDLTEGSELHKVGLRLMRRVDRSSASPEDQAAALDALTELLARHEEHAEP